MISGWSFRSRWPQLSYQTLDITHETEEARDREEEDDEENEEVEGVQEE